MNTTVLHDRAIAEARVISVAQSGVIGENPPAVHRAPLGVHEKSSIVPCPGDLPKEMTVARTPSSLEKLLEEGSRALTRSMPNLNGSNFGSLLSRGNLFGGKPEQLDGQTRGSTIPEKGIPRQGNVEGTEDSNRVMNISQGINTSNEINSRHDANISEGEISEGTIDGWKSRTADRYST